MFKPAEDSKQFLWNYEQCLKQTIDIEKPCQYCSKDKNLVFDLQETGHNVCSNCFRKNKKFYRRITETATVGEYGLSARHLQKAVKEKKIALESTTTKKGLNCNLYYEFQIKQLQLQVYGSVDAWLNKKEALEKKRLNRLLSCYNEDPKPVTSNFTDENLQKSGSYETDFSVKKYKLL